jgi:1-deoxy-D-xylulose-5-phosphate reductoisomerase
MLKALSVFRMYRKKRIAILGSTGSIGVQALEVIQAQPDKFELVAICANKNWQLLAEQANQFKPSIVVIGSAEHFNEVTALLNPLGIEVWSGLFGIETLCSLPDIDLVLNAIVGYAGLLPTIKTLESGKTLALANKESLVVAGELVMRLSRQNDAHILPVDSEHSAIFQCLQGEQYTAVDKLILTASGGPFRGKSKSFLETVTKADALRHPSWTMGSKITIDSASLMNKGLEVIEAHWLFGVHPDNIEVVIHPQSIIHSLVQFVDGSLKAQLSLPDMRLPIVYAMAYPERLASPFPAFSFSDFVRLDFEKPDTDVFRNLHLAYHALRIGGNFPCALNAANEEAVYAFLNDRIKFTDISRVVEQTLELITFRTEPVFNDYVITDKEARTIAITEINNLSFK